MQIQTNNKFYLISYQTGITNERKLCDLFNHKFFAYGFSIRQITDTFSNFDAEKLYNQKSILKVEIKTRANKYFNESGFIFDTVVLNSSKVISNQKTGNAFYFR